jgi:hypothetical protein
MAIINDYHTCSLILPPLAEALGQFDLKGFKVRGKREKLIIALFADDTIVYLEAEDDFEL